MVSVIPWQIIPQGCQHLSFTSGGTIMRRGGQFSLPLISRKISAVPGSMVFSLFYTLYFVDRTSQRQSGPLFCVHKIMGLNPCPWNLVHKCIFSRSLGTIAWAKEFMLWAMLMTENLCQAVPQQMLQCEVLRGTFWHVPGFELWAGVVNSLCCHLSFQRIPTQF